MYTKIVATALVTLTLFSCNQGTKTETKNEGSTETKELTKNVITHVMTKEQQAALTPDAVLQELVEGNKRFNSGNSTIRDLSIQAKKLPMVNFQKLLF